VDPAPPQPHLVALPPRKRSKAPIWVGLLLIGLVCGGAWLYRAQTRTNQTPASGAVRVIRVAEGATARALRVTGTTSARVFAAVNGPRMMGPDAGRGMLLQSIAKSGSLVKPGEVIAEIDSQNIRDHADDIGALVQQTDDLVKRRKADQSIELGNLRQSILAAKASLDKAKLDYRTRDIRTEVDRELLKLAVDEAEAVYNNVSKSLSITQAKFDSQLKYYALERQQQVSHHNRHLRDVQTFTVHAPISGLLVLSSIFRGGDFGQVQQGDQLSPGQPFAKVVNTRTMQLESSVNQAESQIIHIGQSARVHLDAFPNLAFNGKVVSIGALGVSNGTSAYWVRTVPLRIAIEGSDPQLIPDLSASADLQLTEPQHGVLVPIEALANSPEGATVEIRSGTQWKEVPVTVASRTNTTAVVTSGLRPGDEVAISRP
jgi:multidrug efflux pump subunit AcrA (membrane-fusion protein)